MRSAASWTIPSYRVGGGAFEDQFALHTVSDAQLGFDGGEFRHSVREDRASVVLGLEEARNMQELGFPEKRGVVFQFGEVEKGCGQQAAVLLPPSVRPVGRHGDQGVHERLVRAGVLGRKAARPLLADPRETRLDLADLGWVHLEQGRRLARREPCRLAESA